MASDTEQDIPTYIWQSPPIISSNFVGGEKVLEKLHDLLESNPVVVVLGMRGVGKTELALQYVKKYGKKYAGGNHSLDLQDRQLVDELARYQKDISADGIKLAPEQTDPSKLSNWCWEKLEPPKKDDRFRVLVVLDNVDKADRIQGMLPSNPRFRLLVMMGESSKGQSGLVKAHHHEEKLHQLTDKAALELLKKCVGSDRVDENPEAAGKLCNDLLGNLPLGIELAGGYLHQNKTITIAEFFTELSEMQDQLDGDDERPSPAMITQERGVKSVLELTWQRLDPKSQEVCKLFGLFAPRAIPWELVTKILRLKEHKKQGKNKATGEVGKAFDKVGKAWDKLMKKPGGKLKSEQIPKLIANLPNLRLIKWDDKNNTVILDTLIRSFFAEKAQNPESLHEKFVDGMLRVCRDNDLENKNPVRFAVMAPHLEEVATKYTSMLSDLEFDPLFIKVGRFYDRQWMYNAAFQWYSMWLEKADRRLGHPCNTDTRLENLAYMYDAIGNFPENRPNYNRARQICEQQLKKYPLEKKDLAFSLYDLGEILFNKSKYSAALPLYERTVKIVEEEEKNKTSRSDELIANAKKISEKSESAAELEAKKIIYDTNLESEKMINDAKLEAEKIIYDAQLKSEKMKPGAKLESEKMINDVKLESEKMINDANKISEEWKAKIQIKATKMMTDAQSKSDELIKNAPSKATKMMTDAQSKSDELIKNARNTSETLKTNAQSRSNALIEKTKNTSEKLKTDAQLQAEERVRANTQLKADAQSKAEECRKHPDCCT